MTTTSAKLFEWKDAYSVGVAQMDQQHQSLINLINDLQDAMTHGRGNTVIAGILTDLIHYTKAHFAAEEALMQRHGFPGFQQHHDEHRLLTARVEEMAASLKAGRAAMSVRVMVFLKEWLRNHITGTDKQYTAYLNSRGVV